MFLVCFLLFLESFLQKHSNNFFAFKMTNNICPLHSVLNIFHQKDFFRSIWNLAFCKFVFIFGYSNNITNFKLSIFIISFFARVNICASFYIKGPHFNGSMIGIVVFINSSNLSIYTFLILKWYIYRFVL